MPRFMLEGPHRTQSFVLPSYTMHELRNQKSFYWLVPRSVVGNYSVLCRVKAKNESKNIQQRTLSSFITIPFY